ncbi:MULTISPECIES: hypothetical protein [unclassified Streptomyces]|uniref:hypothetical protein n=1 Tax=unclassified Streptomyces TaxID=2593676 RepID=UPI00131CDB33|nr:MULTISPECIES: hypothetical protein [unclassified Streptomyces]
MKDVIRITTRAYRNGSVRGVRTYLHTNCECPIGSTLKGTYSTLADAHHAANKLVKGTGDYYRECSKSGLVKAQVLDRPVRHFDDTMTAAASTFNGAGVRDGDVLVVTSEGVVAIVIGTAVIAITTTRGSLTALDTSARSFRNGLYAEIVDRAAAEAASVGRSDCEAPGTPSGRGPGVACAGSFHPAFHRPGRSQGLPAMIFRSDTWAPAFGIGRRPLHWQPNLAEGRTGTASSNHRGPERHPPVPGSLAMQFPLRPMSADAPAARSPTNAT